VKFTIKDTVPFPREEVYRVQRDSLPDLAPFLNDIQSITVESSERTDDVVKFVNLWKAKGGDIPSVARAFIKPEMLQWHDHATWTQSRWQCDWNMKLGFLPDAIEARGTNTWKELGPNETLVVIEGEIRIHADRIPGVPRLLAKSVGEAVEKFVVKMIEPNLKQTSVGVTNFLRSKKG
jgi:hypothetical protein